MRNLTGLLKALQLNAPRRTKPSFVPTDATDRGSGEHLSSSTPVGRYVLFKREAGLLRFNACLV